MLKSLAARVYFAPKDFADAREISEELGNTTVKARSLTRPRFLRFGAKASERSGNITVSEQRRPLLLPQEVKELGTQSELILYEGLRPIRAKKIRYFSDPRFRRRLLPPPIQAVAATTSVPHRESATEKEGGDHAGHSPNAAHPAAVADIESLETMTLDDFAADFDSVHLPQDRAPTDTELQIAADEFLAALRTA
jgi:type IV secretion system protein VirD4